MISPIRALAALQFTIIVCGVLSADDDTCRGLLQHGIYDYFRQTNDNSSYAQTRKAICDTYNAYEAGSVKADASGNVPLTFSASASVSVQTLKTLYASMCQDDQSVTANQALQTQASSVISSEALNAYVQCRKLADAYLVSDTQYTEDEVGTRQVQIGVRYAPPPGVQIDPKNPPQVKRISVSTEWTCKGDLWDKSNQGTKAVGLDNSFQYVICDRDIKNVAFQDAGRLVLAKASSINVDTGPQAIVRSVVPVFPEPPYKHKQLGEIVASLLDEQKFQNAYGMEWVLAKGQDVSASAYAQLTGNKTLPDLRGRFLYGATTLSPLGDQRGDPNNASLTLTPDQIPQHTHSISLKPWTAQDDLAGLEYAPNPGNHNQGNNWSWQVNQTGRGPAGFENTPQKPVSLLPPYASVNYYIRIN